MAKKFVDNGVFVQCVKCPVDSWGTDTSYFRFAADVGQEEIRDFMDNHNRAVHRDEEGYYSTYQRGRNLPGWSRLRPSKNLPGWSRLRPSKQPLDDLRPRPRAETENFKPDECPKAHVTTKHVRTSEECAMWRLAAQLYPDIKEPR